MNLSEHFTLEEMLHSGEADRLHYAEQYDPPVQVITNLKALCEQVLEPLRASISAQLGKDTPIRITSGYRCPRLNSAIGGAHNSQHILGQAADTHVDGMPIEDWYRFIKTHGVVFDQLIQEFGRWAHISYTTKDPCRMACLRATKDGPATVYTKD